MVYKKHLVQNEILQGIYLNCQSFDQKSSRNFLRALWPNNRIIIIIIIFFFAKISKKCQKHEINQKSEVKKHVFGDISKIQILAKNLPKI